MSTENNTEKATENITTDSIAESNAIAPDSTASDKEKSSATKGKDSNRKKRLDKKNIIIILLVILLIILAIFLMKGRPSESPTGKELLAVENGMEWDGNNPQSGKNSEANSDSIDIAGYANLYLSEEQKMVKLINPKGNTVYFKYVITDETGNILVETGLIAPNQMVERDLYSLLSKGEHTLSFTISTFDVETQEPCNGAVTEVKTVIE